MSVTAASPRAGERELGGSGSAEAASTPGLRTIRAAFHVHSEWSYDARLPLNEIAALFAEEGCEAVFMCEHDRGFSAERLQAYREACREASTAGALLVPGIEYADPQDRVHVPVWGPVPFLGENVPTMELLEAVAAHRGVAVLAHPVRRDAWKTFDPRWLELASGIEIWTRKWDGWAPNPRACSWADEYGLIGVGALDLHNRGQTFPLAMELRVESESRMCEPCAEDELREGELRQEGPRSEEQRDAEPRAEDDLSVEACIQALRLRRCGATIAGRPVAPLTRGPLAGAARAVERVRRPVWRRGRVVRNRLRGGRDRLRGGRARG